MAIWTRTACVATDGNDREAVGVARCWILRTPETWKRVRDSFRCLFLTP